MKSSFNLRQYKEDKDTPIYLVCTINGRQEKLSTGLKVRPQFWDKVKQVAIVSNTQSKTIQLQTLTICTRPIRGLAGLYDRAS